MILCNTIAMILHHRPLVMCNVQVPLVICIYMYMPVYTCTNVVFPDPAIPRQMIQVGLSAIGVSDTSESSGTLQSLVVLLAIVSAQSGGAVYTEYTRVHKLSSAH